jgi:hypothetical protein
MGVGAVLMLVQIKDQLWIQLMKNVGLEVNAENVQQLIIIVWVKVCIQSMLILNCKL